MDELAASPQNEFLASIARALRKDSSLRKGLRAAAPGVDFLLGDADKGFENLSYGDKPWNSKANEPAYDPEKTGPFLDAVGATPFGLATKLAPAMKAGASSQAILAIPALLRNKGLQALNHDLIPSHAMSTVKTPDLPREFYNLSQAVAPRLSPFQGNMHIVGAPGKFDPKTQGTSLTAFDTFSPRHQQAQGKRVDDFAERLSVNHGDEVDPHIWQREMREQAEQRNKDRFLSVYPKAGIFQEATRRPIVPPLPRYGEKPVFEMPELQPPHNLSYISNDRRFQSFEDYMNSPRGAARLNLKGNPNSAVFEAEDFANKHTGSVAPGAEPITVLRELARRPMRPDTPAKELAITHQARTLINQLRNTPSDYAELKSWGPTQVNVENFAGLISHDARSAKRFAAQAKERGIPFHLLSDTENQGNIAREMQAHWLRKRGGDSSPWPQQDSNSYRGSPDLRTATSIGFGGSKNIPPLHPDLHPEDAQKIVMQHFDFAQNNPDHWPVFAQVEQQAKDLGFGIPTAGAALPKPKSLLQKLLDGEL